MSSWREKRLEEMADINPREYLGKDTVAKKIPMDKILPFCRDIPDFEMAPYTGGTKFRNGDTIMARITPCLENGKIAKVGILNDDEVGFGSTEYIVFRAKDGYDADFLYYLITSPLVREPAIKSMVGSSGRQRVQTDVVQKIRVMVPELREQKAIADVLKALDDKIKVNNDINNHLLAQARTITRQWMAVNRDNYELLPLEDIALINQDTYSPKDHWEYVNYLDTSSVTDGNIIEIQHIIPSIEKLPSRARRIIKPGDVVFSTVRPNQRHFGIISKPLPNMLASTGFAVVRSSLPSVCNELIYLCLTEEDFIEKMQQIAEQSTSTFPSIRPADIGACEIPCPKDGEDSTLTEILSTIFSMMSSNQQENKTLSALRASLLPKLMSGEVDVSDVRL